MKDLLDKLSSYNLFNYLLPGILFGLISKQFLGYNFIQDDILVGAFLYYFIGMIISRFGSLIIEPFLRKISFLQFSEYKKFVSAAKKDDKIELLSEVNNTYRSITSMLVLTILIKFYQRLQLSFEISDETTLYSVIVLVLIMFTFSYKKQTSYITKRIEANENP